MKRLQGLAAQVEQHVAKLNANPSSSARHHWIAEVKSWIVQMKEMIPTVGRKTGAAWNGRISTWEKQIEERERN